MASNYRQTIEYIRPSRQSVLEYSQYFTDDTLAAATASYNPDILDVDADARPSRRSIATPAPAFTPVPLHRARTPPQLEPKPARARNRASLQKSPPSGARRPAARASTIERASTDMATVSPPPPRPSRANTATLNDLFAPSQQPSTPSTNAERRLSAPNMNIQHDPYYGDPVSPAGHIDLQQQPPLQAPSTPRLRTSVKSNGTTGKKSAFSIFSFVSTSKRPEISTPYDPVHLTHVGFNASTGEFTGLPREWQQLLQDAGVSRQEQEKNPEAVMEIVKFYQENQGQGRSEANVWEKMGAIKPEPPMSSAPPTATLGGSSAAGSGPTFDKPRVAPAPPKKPSTSAPAISAPSPYRPAPPPPSTPGALDRSTSQRIPKSSPSQGVIRSNTTASPARRSPAPQQQQQQSQQQYSSQNHPQHSHTLPSAGAYGDRELREREMRDRAPSAPRVPNKVTSPLPGAGPASDKSSASPAALAQHGERRVQAQGGFAPAQAPGQSGAAGAIYKAGAQSAIPASGQGQATPRRREKKEKDKAKEEDIVKRLQQICTDADPTKLYRNLVRIGQGCVFSFILQLRPMLIYIAFQRKWRRLHRIPSRHEPLSGN